MAKEMVTTVINENLKKKAFSSEVMHEGRNRSFFSRFTSAKGDNVIWRRNDLRASGKGVIYPFVRSLSEPGVTGTDRLIGNEENLTQHQIWIGCKVMRHAVARYDQDQLWLPWSLDTETKNALINWYSDKLDARLIDALSKDCTNVLYAPNAAGVWPTAENQITAANKLTSNALNGLKAVIDVSWKIFTPVKVAEFGKKYNIGLFHPNVINDLRTDPDWIEIQKLSAERGSTNPLFTGAEGVLHGTICWSYDKIHVTATGAAGEKVYHNLILGERASIHAEKQAMKTIEQLDDYEEVLGRGVRSVEGIEKVVIENEEQTKKTDFGVIKFMTSGSKAPAAFDLFDI